ncbi:DUF134 domain-containing protein [Patescibacteria group bacterium]|nr:DUF134 domain-containing protein [Patescibacteria group bacterium]MBU2235453.1 DUF134 domain-containing protein [Patescibacteria group bacterium]
MVRPRKIRKIQFNPKVLYYKPRGIPLRNLEEVALSMDEVEALRVKYVKGFDQIVCATNMKVSQSTFQRILSSANKKIAEAIISGKAIRIEK